MRCLIVVPARMGSTRFPGKPLIDLAGKPMVQWVYERALASGVGDEVVVATPDLEIVEACRKFGGKVELTLDTHVSGTDRIAEVAKRMSAEIYVNVQGDEPLVDPDTIRACAEALLSDSSAHVSSVMAECMDDETAQSSVVKVVCDLQGYALYFSRAAVPFARNPRTLPVYKHIGLYGYRREAVCKFASWGATPLELTEGLEQLRFLEHGYRIKMARGKASGVAVDEPAHVEAVLRALEAQSAR